MASCTEASPEWDEDEPEFPALSPRVALSWENTGQVLTFGGDLRERACLWGLTTG